MAIRESFRPRHEDAPPGRRTGRRPSIDEKSVSNSRPEAMRVALPREAGGASKINGLRNRLEKNGFIVFQGFSKLAPKRTTGVGVPQAAWAL